MLRSTTMEREEKSTPTSADEIRKSLEQVLDWPGFASKRRGALLRYLVEKTLAGEADRIGEYSIALDVFGKPESFDPRRESTIRAEMSRLRKTLAEYYEKGGASDQLRFEFPTGGYAPTFVRSPAPEPSVARGSRSRRSGWAWAAGILCAVCAGAVGAWEYGSMHPGVRSVVVLPFVNLTGDTADDYLADGITEALTDTLARIPELRVVARTSAFQFRGKATDIREIGKAVSAETAVEGSLRKTEGRLLVTVQVNRTTDGYHLLSRVLEGSPQELSRIQLDLGPAVLAVLRPGLRAPAERPPDAEAFDLVLRARTLRGYGLEDHFNRAVGLLNQAIQKDPRYGGAYAELASAYAAAATNSFVNPLGAAEEAEAAAARALQLDPSSATAYASEGYVDAMVLGKWKQGESEIRSALRLMPQEAAIHQRLGLVLLVQGHFEPALAEARRAADLDPLVPAAGSSIGMVYFMERRYDTALAEWQKLAALHPDALALHSLVGMAYEAKGEYEKARAEYSAIAPQDPVASDLRTMHLLAVCGEAQKARLLLEKLVQTSPGSGLDFAATYAVLGERDKAFEWLERAWENRSLWMLKVHPFLDPLRRDPRYAGLLRRAGFE